jgi:hypothetical protein
MPELKKFGLFNDTDGIPATDQVFTSRAEGERAAAAFRDRFRIQGYYRDSSGNRIAPDDILLAVEELA